jgi:hypothetical protein
MSSVQGVYEVLPFTFHASTQLPLDKMNARPFVAHRDSLPVYPAIRIAISHFLLHFAFWRRPPIALGSSFPESCQGTLECKVNARTVAVAGEHNF